MECKRVKAILGIAAILVLLAVQSSASQCYDDCYAQCRSEDNPDWLCKYKCSLDCIIHLSAAKVDSGCSFACAKASCGQLDPEGNDMRSCLSTCSKSCAKVRKSL